MNEDELLVSESELPRLEKNIGRIESNFGVSLHICRQNNGNGTGRTGNYEVQLHSSPDSPQSTKKARVSYILIFLNNWVDSAAIGIILIWCKTMSIKIYGSYVDLRCITEKLPGRSP